MGSYNSGYKSPKRGYSLVILRKTPLITTHEPPSSASTPSLEETEEPLSCASWVGVASTCVRRRLLLELDAGSETWEASFACMHAFTDSYILRHTYLNAYIDIYPRSIHAVITCNWGPLKMLSDDPCSKA